MLAVRDLLVLGCQQQIHFGGRDQPPKRLQERGKHLVAREPCDCQVEDLVRFDIPEPIAVGDEERFQSLTQGKQIFRPTILCCLADNVRLDQGASVQ